MGITMRQSDSKNAAALYNQGNVFFRLGRYDEAIVSLSTGARRRIESVALKHRSGFRRLQIFEQLR